MTISKREAMPPVNVHLETGAEENWRDRASCIGLDVNDFFPEGQGQSVPSEVRRVCAACPSLQACLDHALSFPERHGIFGGTSPAERRHLKLGDVAPLIGRKCAGCGAQLGRPRAKTCKSCQQRAADTRRREANQRRVRSTNTTDTEELSA